MYFKKNFRNKISKKKKWLKHTKTPQDESGQDTHVKKGAASPRWPRDSAWSLRTVRGPHRWLWGGTLCHPYRSCRGDPRPPCRAALYNKKSGVSEREKQLCRGGWPLDKPSELSPLPTVEVNPRGSLWDGGNWAGVSRSPAVRHEVPDVIGHHLPRRPRQGASQDSRGARRKGSRCPSGPACQTQLEWTTVQ